ncbi:DUF2101 family protein [Thermococcus sp.]|uniref:DUF2101 family protein n=1 Tax=Thermococcus sp. TaxID=35749 RepID=UPI0026333746|nr:DUF2101 family protein [Thermococcus sp.]
MSLEDFLYSIGEKIENLARMIIRGITLFFNPKPSKKPPVHRFISKFMKKGFTVHELVSLHLQIAFLLYVLLAFILVVSTREVGLVGILSICYLLYLRYYLKRYSGFLIEPEPYRVFYTGVSLISSFSFVGYVVLKKAGVSPYSYYSFLGLIVILVVVFWIYFKRKFGREFTYGVVEEIKGDLVRVFVHDDISANVKPGFYWLPAVPDAEPGRIVKVLVENRNFRSAKPIRIIEVYLSQSSQSSTEPKNATE